MTDDRRSLGEMDHTNPYTDRAFGATQTYSRGKTVAADGGEADRASDDDAETLDDIEHTSPEDGDGPQRTFDRGDES
mgnify:CR=1 FL=1